MSGPPADSSPLIDLPSVVASKILSYVPWQEKLTVVQVVTSWTEALRSTEAWGSVKYGPEIEENVYFAQASRADFLACVKQYGHFMRSIHLCFGYSIARKSVQPTGLEILTYIHKRCCNLASLSIEQEVPEGTQTGLQYCWSSLVGNLIKDIAVSCKSMQSVALCQPIIWDEESENILLILTKSCAASKITELELTGYSLYDQEGKLQVLKNFTSLKKLTVPREKVNEEILLHLVKHSLKELVMYQEEELPYEEQHDLGEDFWLEVKKICPQFRVDLILRCVVILKILLPPTMPVRNLVLDFLVNVITKGIMDHIADSYRDTLKRFTYTNSFLENQEMGDDRVPASLISLTQKCSHLETLEYGFPLSSSAILLIADSRKLKHLVIPSVEVSYVADYAPLQYAADYVHVHRAKREAADDFKIQNSIGSCRRNLEKTVSHLLKQQWTLHDGPIKVNERVKL